MKNKIFKYLLLIGFAGCYSCYLEYALPEIAPDLALSNRGLVYINTISIYDEVEYEMTISRSQGLSQEVKMITEVSQEMVDDYNSLYDADLQVMSPQYYSIASEVTFPALTGSIKISLSVNPSALITAVGKDNIKKYVLPLKITPANGPVMEIILGINPEEPTITVNADQISSLDFIMDIPITQTANIEASANFTTLDVTKISYSADASAVETYNNASGENRALLDPSCYTVREDVFDPDKKTVSSPIELRCHTLPPGNGYVLPLKLTQSSNYKIVQETVCYILVNISNSELSVDNGGTVVANTTGTGTITVRLNAPIEEDQVVKFVYDATKIAEYNTANGTNYQAVANANVQAITSTKIAAGTTYVEVPFTVDMGNLDYDAEMPYAVAFTLQNDDMVLGTSIIGDPTAFIEIRKTIVGWYNRTTITSSFPESVANYVHTIYHNNVIINDKDVLPSYPEQSLWESEAVNGQAPGKYAIYTYELGGGNYYFFDITDRAMAGHSGCFELDIWLFSSWDEMLQNKSYFDPSTGTLYFDYQMKSYWDASVNFNMAFSNRTDSKQ